jgi:vancomycin permeability regulator SanA
MNFFVVFGASIKPNGEPSGAMQRRIGSALALAQHSTGHVFLLTGTPAEFNLMRTLLRREGVADDHILEESNSASTLASVIHCASLMRRAAPPHGSVVIFSDRYHVPRCRWLFYLLNVRTTAARVPSGREANGLLRWTYFYVREMVALPVDTLILVIRRPRILLV